jgi:hypothetical protein
MEKNHLLIQPKRNKESERFINILNNNNIKNEIIKYVLQYNNLNLSPLQVCEGGFTINNKELRFRPSNYLWDYDYKGVPLYNRISENLFTRQELENIKYLIIMYFDNMHDIKLKSKFVSMKDLNNIMFKNNTII